MHGQVATMDTLQGNPTGTAPARQHAVTKACYSVDEFCGAHNLSRAMFYKILKEGTGPRVMRVGTRTLISEEAAGDWRRQMEAA
jgi:hypothetical protein